MILLSRAQDLTSTLNILDILIYLVSGQKCTFSILAFEKTLSNMMERKVPGVGNCFVAGSVGEGLNLLSGLFTKKRI